MSYICLTAANIVKQIDTSTLVDKKNLFGENLRMLRKGIGMSQDALGQALSVGRTTIVNWENGTSTPTIDTLVELSKFLNTSPDRLLLGPSTYLNKEAKSAPIAREPEEVYHVTHRDIPVVHRDMGSASFTITLPQITDLIKEVQLLRAEIEHLKTKKP